MNYSYNELLEFVNSKSLVHSKTFINGLEQDDSYKLWACVKGCGELQLSEALPKLFSLLSTKLEKHLCDVSGITVWAIAQFDFTTIESDVKELIENPVNDSKAYGADILGFFNNEQSLFMLGELLNDNGKVLSYACLSLSKHGEVAIPLLKAHLVNSASLEKKVLLLDALKRVNTDSSNSVIKEYFQEEKSQELLDIRERFLG